MKNKKEVEIDFKKFQEQKRKNFLKNKKYAKLELIVVPDDEEPYVNIELTKIKSDTVAAFIAILEKTLKDIKKEYPLETFLSEMMFEITDMGTTILEGDENNE